VFLHRKIMKKFGKVFVLAVASIFALTLSACGAETQDVEFQTTETHLQWRLNEDDEWENLVELDEISGEEGPTGPAGSDGAEGPAGADGADGAAGADGADGADGVDGDSAYDLYVEHNPGYEGTVEEWLLEMASGDLVHTVTLELDGGELTEDEEATFSMTKGAALDAILTPTKTGSEFLGWYTDDTLDTALDTGAYIDEDMTLYASWENVEVDVATALDVNIGDSVVVRGTISNITDDSTFFIEDSNGAIAVYDGAGDYLLNASGDSYALTVGDEVVVSGERDADSGLEQISTLTDVTVDSSGNTLPAVNDLDGVDLNDDTLMVDYLGHRVNLNDFVVYSVESSWPGIVLTVVEPVTESTLTIEINGIDDHLDYTAIETELNSYSVGDAINVTGATLGWNNGPKILIGAVDQIEAGTLTDAMLDGYVGRNMPSYPEETVSDINLPTDVTAGSTTYSVSWASDNETAITIDGTVTRPVIGETDATVTLTATVTHTNGYTNDFVYTVTVPAVMDLTASDLFISEYIEGSSNNKALEIYNGTGADVDMTDYTVELYSNGSDSAGNTLDLTGTLVDGEVFVIYNSQADVAIQNVGDVTSTVTYFNGNDAVTLSKSDSVIDIIGEVGVDNYWEVGNGSTSGNTLVRQYDVDSPVDTWDPTEWDVYPEDTFDDLGTHVFG